VVVGFIYGPLVVLFRTIVSKNLFQLVETEWIGNRQDSKHKAQARGVITGWMRCLKLILKICSVKHTINKGIFN